MNKTKLSQIIDVNIRTIHNWEKNRPKLFQFLKECIEKKEKNEIFSLNDEEKELIKSYRELNEEEKKLYLYEIKARALRRKLG